MEKFIKLNIAIIPSKQISDLAIDLSKELSKKYKTEFILGNRRNHPHVSLYHLDVLAKEIGRIGDCVERAVRAQKQFQVNLEKPALFFEDLWAMFPVVNNNILDQFHKSIINGLSPEKKLFKEIQYGLSEIYSPHLTITLLNKRQNVDFQKSALNNMNVKEIGIFDRGDHSTCNKLLYKFKLN